ncbi:MAG: alpha/beta hydrolase [Thermoanaerobaculia bacterium]|nr:alpha/beta hydrolase [Thermoanaerobaculia bacterium]
MSCTSTLKSVAALALAFALAASAGAQSSHPSFDVQVTGTGPAIVLIPGLLSSGEVWDTTVARYKDRYTLHVLTLAGFGGPAPVGAPFLPRVREELIGYIRAAGLDRPIVAGHSLGGFLSFWIAATAPELVGGVVAVDGVPFLPALMNPAATADDAKVQGEQIRTMYAAFTTDQLVSQSRMALATMITAPGDVERALAWARQSDPATAGIAVAELMSTDLRRDVAAITAPTLLIGASGAAPDTMQPAFQKAYELQLAAAPKARVIMATKARHFIMFDDPAFLFAALDEFLAGSAAGPRR